MAVYRICPYCGAALDPGERCDCKEESIGQKAEELQLFVDIRD